MPAKKRRRPEETQSDLDDLDFVVRALPGAGIEELARTLEFLWRKAYEQRRRGNAPTSAKPGSAEKIAVMISRVEANRSPFHPKDNYHCACGKNFVCLPCRLAK